MVLRLFQSRAMRKDCGKKAFWEEGLVMKKAIQPQRCRLSPGFDGTWCKLKIISATLGEELHTASLWSQQYIYIHYAHAYIQ